MASEGGGKIKNRRHISIKPYERQKSLFRRITDSIKDVLRPSWMVGRSDCNLLVGQVSDDQQKEQSEHLLQSHSTSTSGCCERLPVQGGCIQMAEHVSEGSTDVLNIPHNKTEEHGRICSDSHTSPNCNSVHRDHYSRIFFECGLAGNSEPMCHASDNCIVGLGKPLQGKRAPVESTSRLQAARGCVKPSVLFGAEGNVDGAEGNASVCHIAGCDSDVLVTTLPSSSSQEPGLKRRRLWSSDVSRKGRCLQQPVSHGKPEFKVSLFHSPNTSESLLQSSFYDGNTVYGGASSACRRSPYCPTPYQNSLPIRKVVKPKMLSNSNNAVLSASASQILKTLERISDEKETNRNQSTYQSLLSFTPSSYRRKPKSFHANCQSRPLSISSHGPPANRLSSVKPVVHIPNRQFVVKPAPRDSSVITDVVPQQEGSGVDVQVVRHFSPAGSSVATTSTKHTPATIPSTDHETIRPGGKMRHSKSYETNRRKMSHQQEAADDPLLEMDFRLPVSVAPHLDISFPTAKSFDSLPKSSTITTTTTSLSSTALPTTTDQLSEKNTAKMRFQFASPIQVSSRVSTSSVTSATCFNFSTPLKSHPAASQSAASQSAASVEELPNRTYFGIQTPASSHGGIQQAFSSVAQVQKPAITDLEYGNGASTAQINHPSVNVRSTVTRSIAQSSTLAYDVALASELKSGSVMDILGKGAVSSASSNPLLFSAGGGPEKEKNAAPSGSGWGDVMDRIRPVGSWTCETCLVLNTAEMVKCPACETAKPSSMLNALQAPAPEKVLTTDQAVSTDQAFCRSKGGGATLSSGWGSLMDKFRPPGSWSCDTCMVQNGADVTRCPACDSLRATSVSSAPPSGDRVLDSAREMDADVGGVKSAPDANARGRSGDSAGFVVPHPPAAGHATPPSLFPTGFTGVVAPTTATSVAFQAQSPVSSATGFMPNSQVRLSSAGSELFQFGRQAASAACTASAYSSAGFQFQPKGDSVDSTNPKTNSQCKTCSSPFSLSPGVGMSAVTSVSMRGGAFPAFPSAGPISSALEGQALAVSTSMVGRLSDNSKIPSPQVSSTPFAPTFAPVFGSSQPFNSLIPSGAVPSAAGIATVPPTVTGFGFGSPHPCCGHFATSSISVAAFSSSPMAPGTFGLGGSNIAVSQPESFVGVAKVNGLSKFPASSSVTAVDVANRFGLRSQPVANSSSLSHSFIATAVKSPVNGDVSAPSGFSFGQHRFGMTTPSLFGNAVENLQASPAAVPPFTFGLTTDSSKPFSKRPMDSDCGTTAAKKHSSFAEGFSFGKTGFGETGSSIFNSNQPDGKPASFGNPASGFGASSGFDGFNFSATHPDAGGGVGGGQSHRTVFGTSTSSNQFSFSSADTNQMNNAATFRPAFGAEPSTANISQGFNFGGSSKALLEFGKNISSTPVFQFNASAPSPTANQSSTGGVFMFGQGAPSTESSFPSLPTTNFGMAPGQNCFTIGAASGMDGSRKIKRAMRRTVRKT